MELAKVPGYIRARDRAHKVEESYREYSYLDAPEFISGIEIRPLTFQMYLQLCAAKSPFLVGGVPFIQDVGVFLFRLSPAYDQAFAAKEAARAKVTRAAALSFLELRRFAIDNKIISAGRSLVTGRSALVNLLQENAELIAANAFKRAQRRFHDNILLLPFRERDPMLKRTIRSIDRFVDRMLLDKPIASKRKAVSFDPSDTSTAADVIHLIASSYGWPRRQILQLAMPEVFQALRVIQRDLPGCPKRAKARVHPIAARLTRKHKKIAEDAALAAAAPTQPCS